MTQSEGQLPKLFEPSYNSIELGYDYSQEVFDNDIFIFNLDDSYLPEVEFIIRGLENGEYEKEKIIILISNIMTWGETPLKTFTEEEKSSPDFNEEEVPEIKEEIIKKEEIKPMLIPVEIEKPPEEKKEKPIKGKGKNKKGKKSKGKDKEKEKEKEDKKSKDKNKKKVAKKTKSDRKSVV